MTIVGSGQRPKLVGGAVPNLANQRDSLPPPIEREDATGVVCAVSQNHHLSVGLVDGPPRFREVTSLEDVLAVGGQPIPGICVRANELHHASTFEHFAFAAVLRTENLSALLLTPV
ncbi:MULTISPECIES: hypothetical protein [Brevibacterium]|uniref:hypothetical protein n=1 Tax=Brevibacterium TaxID=1696 RepID=UPI001F15BC1E|nr:MULTISPECIES: hypothetical protein [Brevibacterium]